MKVDYVEEGSSLRHMDIELPADDLNDQFEKGVRSLSRSVKLPGFRKGKIPKDVIRQRFRSDVLEHAIQDLVPKAVNEALKERELYPIDDPRVSNLESKLGEPLRFRATFEVIPTIEVRDYKGIEATEQKTEVTDEQIEVGIEHLREQNARFDPIEGRGAQDHDIVLGNLVETPSGGGPEKRHKDVSIEVGTEAYHKSLHEMLQGAEPGAQIAFSATFDGGDGGDGGEATPTEATPSEPAKASTSLSTSKSSKRRSFPTPMTSSPRISGASIRWTKSKPSFAARPRSGPSARTSSSSGRS